MKKKCQKIEGMQAGALGRREGRASEGRRMCGEGEG